MKTRLPYSYSVLRYVHDNATGEFINIGVALHCSVTGFFKAEIKSTIGRVTDTFPDVSTTSYKSLVKGIKNRFSQLNQAYSDSLNLEKHKNALKDILSSVLPEDDSALVWGAASQGLTSDPNKTLQDLYLRYVGKYDQRRVNTRKTDEDVWRNFKKDLADRRLLTYFNEKIIEGKSDEVKFPFAWKNGIWHCIEPLSFDLSAAESIRDKAHKCLGQITSVIDTNEKFRLYLLLSKPSESTLQEAFDKALNILDKIPVNTEIYFEDNKDTLLEKLSTEITTHEAEMVY